MYIAGMSTVEFFKYPVKGLFVHANTIVFNFYFLKIGSI